MLGLGSTRSQVELRHSVLPRQGAPLPAWPVLSLFYGVLGWWALGLMPFSSLIVAVPMLLLLVYRARVQIPPGVLPWIAFVIWVIPTAIMLDSSGQIIGWFIRESQFIAIGVIIIYVANARRSITPQRLLDAMTGMWVSLIIGGYLGLLWPNGQLTWTIGRLLPGSIRANDYVQDLVFPTFAEVQEPWGAVEPFVRPAAPFSYTNGWGAALAVLTPLVVAGVLLGRSRARLLILSIGGVAAIAPIAASTNRGLVVSIACTVIYVLVREIMRGRWRSVLTIGVLVGVAAWCLSVAGLFGGIEGRQDTVDTTDGRADLYTETFNRTLNSPLLGFGYPRPSFTSEISVGTQGAVWNTMFCFGFIGLVLFVLFLVGVLARTWSAPTSPLLWMHAGLLSIVVIAPFYGLDRHLIVFAAVAGLMLRERYAPQSALWPKRARNRG